MAGPRHRLASRSLAATLVLGATVLAFATAGVADDGGSATPATASPGGKAPKGTVDPETGQRLDAPPDPVSAALPAAVDADRFSTRTPIKHVVFLIMENRSFDNVFGRFPGADGTRVGNDDGSPRPLTKASLQRAHDLPH